MTSADSRYSHSSPLYSASTWTAQQTFNAQIIAESPNDANSVNLSFQNPAVDGSHIQYAFSKRSDNEDLWLYAYDGSAYWNALKFDHGATKLIVDGDLEFTGPQKITTSSSNLTLDPAGGTNIGVPATANSTNGAMTVEGYLDVEGYAAFGNGTAAQTNVGITLDFDVTAAYHDRWR